MIVNDIYTPPHIDGDLGKDDLIERETGNFMNVGQPYAERRAQKIACKICNATAFEVGQDVDVYFTAIRCVSCGWEVCIHEG